MNFKVPAVFTAALLLAGGLAFTAVSEDVRKLPQSQAEVRLSYAPLVKQTAPSVVNVYAERTVVRSTIFDNDPFFRQFFGGGQGRRQTESSLGSGVIVGENGIVITNNHVIEGADDIKVALSDGREFKSKVMLKDDKVDLAVLKIETTEKLPPLQLGDSDKLEVGDIVLAIGDPFGVGQTVTSGIVSGLARGNIGVSDFGYFIQTDASINPGNSGGALIDMKGDLIGINSAIFSKGGGSNGIGFAIPANLAKVFIEAAERGDKTFERPYVGASFDAVSADVADALGLKRAGGAFITKVAKGGPAEQAGLVKGDTIVALNGIPIQHPDALGYRMLTAGLGSDVKLTVYRDGKEREVSLKLDRAPEIPPRDERRIDGRNPFAGIVAVNLSPRVADELQMPGDNTGVAIRKVEDGSPADQLGFAKGDIIVSVNGTAIEDTKTLAQMANSDPNIWRVEINRGGQRIRQVFR
ncbi:MAG TPA: DegQ family serine endoprotease [Ensifer sp.]|nr:DegQ family serine endoprotease [Ensifer sp.]